jgi:hypothetical protein
VTGDEEGKTIGRERSQPAWAPIDRSLTKHVISMKVP